MRENMYNLGYSMAMVIPLVIAIFCITKIRKNKAEIKKLEEEEKQRRKTTQSEDE